MLKEGSGGAIKFKESQVNLHSDIFLKKSYRLRGEIYRSYGVSNNKTCGRRGVNDERPTKMKMV